MEFNKIVSHIYIQLKNGIVTHNFKTVTRKYTVEHKLPRLPGIGLKVFV